MHLSPPLSVENYDDYGNQRYSEAVTSSVPVAETTPIESIMASG